LEELVFLLLLCFLLEGNVEFLEEGVGEKEVNEVALAIGYAIFDCQQKAVGVVGLGR
jgi:hypothetical protein